MQVSQAPQKKAPAAVLLSFLNEFQTVKRMKRIEIALRHSVPLDNLGKILFDNREKRVYG
jgi:hypothetical protein